MLMFIVNLSCRPNPCFTTATGFLYFDDTKRDILFRNPFQDLDMGIVRHSQEDVQRSHVDSLLETFQWTTLYLFYKQYEQQSEWLEPQFRCLKQVLGINEGNEQVMAHQVETI